MSCIEQTQKICYQGLRDSMYYFNVELFEATNSKKPNLQNIFTILILYWKRRGTESRDLHHNILLVPQLKDNRSKFPVVIFGNHYNADLSSQLYPTQFRSFLKGQVPMYTRFDLVKSGIIG